MSFFQKKGEHYRENIALLTDELSEIYLNNYAFLGKSTNQMLLDLMKNMKKKFGECEEDQNDKMLEDAYAEPEDDHGMETDVTEIDLFKDMTRLE